MRPEFNHGDHLDQMMMLSAIEQLRALSMDIETVVAALCVDPDIMAKHMTTLQAIDMIAQKKRAIADVLAAASPYLAASEVTVERLRDELIAGAGG